MPELALIGLGSNLGDRKAHLDLAVASLSKTPGVTVRALSSFRETPSVGGPAGQGAFLNAAASLETTLEPESLLDLLNAVEHDAGRIRSVRWGERTLDLDLILYGDRVVETPRLTIPHPRMAFRRFVLAPLAEIATDSVDPITGRTVGDLLANLDRRPSYVAIACKPDDLWIASHDCLRHLSSDSNPRLVNILESTGGLNTPYTGPGANLHERLRDAIPAFSVLDQPHRPPEAGLLDSLAHDRGLWFERLMTFLLPRCLEEVTLRAAAPGDDWVISPFWFDTLFLSLDTLKTARPRHARYREEFLEARSRVLAPTFVVARPRDREAWALDDGRFAWHHPIGRDTPILDVADFDSDAALAEVLAACAATRSG